MDTLRVHAVWTGRDTDVLSLLPEPWGVVLWEADPLEENPLVALYLERDEADHPTDRVVGLEIIDFLTFDEWDLLTDQPDRWQLDDQPPSSLVNLLRGLQASLRAKAGAQPEAHTSSRT